MTYSYCTQADVTPLLGDLTLPSTTDFPGMINKASADITLWLGQRYALPLPTGNAYTTLLLTEASAELTAAYIIMAQAQGGEDNRVNAYGKYLADRAASRLNVYMCGETILPGGTVISDTGTVGGPVAVYNQDSFSPLEYYYRYMQAPTIEVASQPWSIYGSYSQ
jgi:hypothetical protein